MRVVCDRPRELAAAVLGTEGIVGVRFPGVEGGVEIETRDPDGTYTAVARAAVEGGFDIHSLTSPDATLEALFHYLVERSSRMAGTGADAGVGSAMGAGYEARLSPGGNAEARP